MEIKDYICELVFTNKAQKLTQVVAEQYGISRQAAQRHIKKLVDANILTMNGATNAAKYELVTAQKYSNFELTAGINEDSVWRSFVRPELEGIPQNVISICQYGFTEMFNNAIDHSEGESVNVFVRRSAYHIGLSVNDNGIGIFRKIRRDFGLDDERHAILELSKGKLTSDASRHSGEGIFFASRMFDTFTIFSGNYFLSHSSESDKDRLIDREKDDNGTSVLMSIRINSKRTTQSIFEEFSTIDHPGFFKTIVPVALATYGDENMVSRSQAKRVLARVEKFTEVELDFKGVTEVGQAFVDEIFRIFDANHPNVNINYVNANDSIVWMIRRCIASNTND